MLEHEGDGVLKWKREYQYHVMTGGTMTKARRFCERGGPKEAHDENRHTNFTKGKHQVMPVSKGENRNGGDEVMKRAVTGTSLSTLNGQSHEKWVPSEQNVFRSQQRSPSQCQECQALQAEGKHVPLCGWSSKKKAVVQLLADDRNTEGGPTNRTESSYIGNSRVQCTE